LKRRRSEAEAAEQVPEGEISWNGKWKKVHVNIQINGFMKG
jgi:hypothetical protein